MLSAFSLPASIITISGLSGSKIQLIESSTRVVVLLPIFWTLNSDIAVGVSIKSKKKSTSLG